MQRVLITRPEPGASQTASRLIALGMQPVVAPVLIIQPAEIRVPRGVAATILTSGNAVASCPLSLHGLPAFAVGTATARRAAEAGFANVVDAGADAARLAEVIAATTSPAAGTLLLPAAMGQGMELANALRTRGFRVIRRVAYRAAGVSSLPEPAAAAFRAGTLATALFFSGETARRFVRLVQTAGFAESVRNVEAVSISERAAVALRVLPWRRIRVAEKPNQDSMLVLLK